MASLEDTKLITEGAEVLAHGAALGLNPEQTIAIANTNREQVRENIRRRRAEREKREGNRAAAEAFLSQDDANFQAKGGLTPFQKQLARGGNVQVDIDDEGFAFGEDAQVIVDKKGRRIEREPRRPQDDDQHQGGMKDPSVREIQVRNDVLPKEFLKPEEVARQREGTSVMTGGSRGYTRRVNGEEVKVRGKSPVMASGQGGMRAMQDALNQLEMAKEQYGFAAFGEEGVEMERIYNRLKDQLEGGGKRKDRDEARKAVLADAQRRRGAVTDEEIVGAADRAIADQRFDREEVKKYGEDKDDPILVRTHPVDRVSPLAVDPQPTQSPSTLRQAIIEEGVVRRRDGAMGGPEQRAADNAYEARKEGVLKRGREGGVPQRIADRAIAAIPGISQLGAAGPAAHGVLHEDNLQFGGSAQGANFPGAIAEIGPDGSPVAYFGNVDGQFQELGKVNAPDSANSLNAPKSTPMMNWVAENQPLFGKNNVFGEPQVEINDAMALIGDRVRGLSGLGLEGVGNPRNLGEVEQLLGAVVGRGQQAGKQFFRFDRDQGKNVQVAQPGVAEVMNMLRIPPAQQGNIAWALMQNELGNAQDINQTDKANFANRVSRPLGDNVVMNASEMRADGGTPIDMIVNEKVGRGKKARGVRAALAAIDGDPVLQALNERGELFTTAQVKDRNGNIKNVQVLLPEAARIIEGAQMARNDAQMPMQGGIKGEGVQRARFVSPAGRKMSNDEMVAKYGAENAAIAREVMDRYDRDEAKRAASPIDPGAALQRRKDASAAEMGRRAQRDFEDKEIGELYKLMTQGRQFSGSDRFEMEGKRPILDAEGNQTNMPVRIPGGQPGEKLRVAYEKDLTQSDSPAAKPATRTIKYRNGTTATINVGKQNARRMVQPTREASVPMSIAPEPGAGTGSQPAPMVDAGGVGGQPPARTAVAGGPMPEDMRKELFSLPRTKMSPFEAQLAQNAIKKRANREQLRNRAGIGAAALGGVAGLLGLANIGREEEVEEQY